MNPKKSCEGLRCSNGMPKVLAWACLALAFVCCALRDASAGIDRCCWSEPQVMIQTSGPQGQRMIYFESWCTRAPQELPILVEVGGLPIKVQLVKVKDLWFVTAAAPFVQRGAENLKGLPVWDVPESGGTVLVVIRYKQGLGDCRYSLPVKFSQAL